MNVRNDKSHTGQPSRHQRAQEAQPEGTILARANVQTHDLPLALRVHSCAHHHAHVDYPASLSHLLRQRIQLENSTLSQSFAHRLLGFVHETHAHDGYLEEIADGLKAMAGDSLIQDAAAGGVVLKALRKKMHYTQFRSLDDRLASFGFEAPRFAMEEFIEEMRPVIHNVPIGIGIVRVTCCYTST